MHDTWTYRPLTWPLPQCQACALGAGTVAVYEGRVCRHTLCWACAVAHRAAQTVRARQKEELDGQADLMS